MSLKLFFDYLSQPSRALVMFVRFNKIPCEEVQIALRKGEQFSEDFAKINRFKKVPCITHDDLHLSESVAIMRYLARTFPIEQSMYPREDSEKIARIDEYMEWQHLNMRAMGSLYFQEVFIKPLLKGEPPIQGKVDKLADNLRGVLDVMENVWLKENRFVAGNELTIADLLATTELEQPRMVGFDVTKGYPKIGEYMENVRKLLHPHYDQAHEIAWSVREKYLKKNAAGAAANK